MWSRRLLVASLAVLAGLWDACVASWFPGSWAGLQVGLLFTVMLAIFSSPERWMIGAIVSGSVASTFLSSNGGLMPLRFFAVGFVISYLSQRLFTNRSLMSVVALSGCATLIDRSVLWLMEHVQIWSGRSLTFESHATLGFAVIWSCIVGATVFFLFVLFSKRFLPLITIGRASKRMGRVRL